MAGQALMSEGDPLLRLEYSMAIIRLVNGVVDSSQKGRKARSVADIASEAGAGAPASPCLPPIHQISIF